MDRFAVQDPCGLPSTGPHSSGFCRDDQHPLDLLPDSCYPIFFDPARRRAFCYFSNCCHWADLHRTVTAQTIADRGFADDPAAVLCGTGLLVRYRCPIDDRVHSISGHSYSGTFRQSAEWPLPLPAIQSCLPETVRIRCRCFRSVKFRHWTPPSVAYSTQHRDHELAVPSPVQFLPMIRRGRLNLPCPKRVAGCPTHHRGDQLCPVFWIPCLHQTGLALILPVPVEADPAFVLVAFAPFSGLPPTAAFRRAAEYGVPEAVCELAHPRGIDCHVRGFDNSQHLPPAVPETTVQSCRFRSTSSDIRYWCDRRLRKYARLAQRAVC